MFSSTLPASGAVGLCRMGFEGSEPMSRIMFAAVIAVSVCAAPAQAGCWQGQHAAAAKVRDLQSMLMVAALRCRGTGVEVLADYNSFVVANRATITVMNDRLKDHFFADYGRAGGQREYDRFTTALANAYGAGEGSASCADMAALARETTEAGTTPEALIRIAEREGRAPALPGGACPVIMASAEPR